MPREWRVKERLVNDGLASGLVRGQGFVLGGILFGSHFSDAASSSLYFGPLLRVAVPLPVQLNVHAPT